MQDLDSAMTFEEQLDALIEMFDNQFMLLKWCREERKELVDLKQNGDSDDELFSEDILRRAINSAFAVASPNDPYPNIMIQDDGSVTIDLVNIWDKYAGRPNSAFSDVHARAKKKPEGMEAQVVGWFHRNDPAGLQSVLTGRPRSDFPDPNKEKRELAGAMASLGL